MGLKYAHIAELVTKELSSGYHPPIPNGPVYTPSIIFSSSSTTTIEAETLRYPQAWARSERIEQIVSKYLRNGEQEHFPWLRRTATKPQCLPEWDEIAHVDACPSGLPSLPRTELDLYLDILVTTQRLTTAPRRRILKLYKKIQSFFVGEQIEPEVARAIVVRIKARIALIGEPLLYIPASGDKPARWGSELDGLSGELVWKDDREVGGERMGLRAAYDTLWDVGGWKICVFMAEIFSVRDWPMLGRERRLPSTIPSNSHSLSAPLAPPTLNASLATSESSLDPYPPSSNLTTPALPAAESFVLMPVPADSTSNTPTSGQLQPPSRAIVRLRTKPAGAAAPVRVRPGNASAQNPDASAPAVSESSRPPALSLVFASPPINSTPSQPAFTTSFQAPQQMECASAEPGPRMILDHVLIVVPRRSHQSNSTDSTSTATTAGVSRGQMRGRKALQRGISGGSVEQAEQVEESEEEWEIPDSQGESEEGGDPMDLNDDGYLSRQRL